jgi:hypothetical protein
VQTGGMLLRTVGSVANSVHCAALKKEQKYSHANEPALLTQHIASSVTYPRVLFFFSVCTLRI